METRQQAISSSYRKAVLDLLTIQLGGQSLQDKSVMQDEMGRVRQLFACCNYSETAEAQSSGLGTTLS